VDRRERERILGEWGLRDGSLREQAAQETLADDLAGSPLHGQSLRRRLRNFRPAVETYVASLGGPLPYMVRLREIEAETARHEEELERAWHALAEECRDEREFSARWQSLARRWSFAAVNELIAKHNRYYPIEARLPMDVRTGDFVLVNGRPYDRRPLDAAWVLDRFPPTLPAAAAA
jgi:hypothetical protein